MRSCCGANELCGRVCGVLINSICTRCVRRSGPGGRLRKSQSTETDNTVTFFSVDIDRCRCRHWSCHMVTKKFGTRAHLGRLYSGPPTITACFG